MQQPRSADSTVRSYIWPQESQYLRPGFDDPTEISSLLNHDVSYTNIISPWHLACVTLIDGDVQKQYIPPTNLEEHDLFQSGFDKASLTVLHIRFSRSYLATGTTSHMSLGKADWRYILHRLDIMPSFVKLLHNNNGGSFTHFTYGQAKACNNGERDGKPANMASRSEQSNRPDISALHLAYKLGMSAEQELAIYARLDIERDQRLILVLGHDSGFQLDRIYDMLRAHRDAAWLSVMPLLFSRRYDMIEGVRWNVDFRTQQHEALTGYAAFGETISAVKAKDLEFDRDLYVTTDMCRDVAYGAKRLLLNCEAFMSHLNAYKLLVSDYPALLTLSSEQYRSEQQDCARLIEQLKHQIDQIADLRARLFTQADVKKTLINQRDMQLTLEISQATKRDSELMRGIAAVTMIFLPATFVATFFSMVFFHVNDGDTTQLMVDGNIWFYPVVTVPLTLGISLWYFAWSFGWLTKMLGRSARRKELPSHTHTSL